MCNGSQQSRCYANKPHSPDPVWRSARTVNLHGRHANPDLICCSFVCNIQQAKMLHNCLIKTGGTSEYLSGDHFNKSKNNIYISGGPLSALTCCVNVRLLSAIKSRLI